MIKIQRLAMALIRQFRPIIVKIFPIAFLRSVKKLMIKQSVKEVSAYKLPPFDPSNGQKGVNLIGYIQGEIGLGQSCRLVAAGLEVSKVPFIVYNYQQVSAMRSEDHSWDHKISKETPYNINLFHINPYEVPLAFSTLTPAFWDNKYNIAFWLWELEDFPPEWCFAINCFHEIWTPAEFVSESIRKVTDKPVYTMPYFLQVSTDPSMNRKRFNLPEDVFLFLTMYDCNSTMERKNPMGAVYTFKKAFSPNDTGVGLVIKVNNPTEEDLKKLRQELKGYANIWLLSGVYTKVEINSLIADADVLVSLHRAEGFGLVPAEAMLLGTPVIATNWSANTEFMDCQTACMVDYTLVPIEKDCGPYHKGQRWAEPNLDQAADYMRKLYQDSEYYCHLVDAGRSAVSRILSREQAGERIRNRVNEIFQRVSDR